MPVLPVQCTNRGGPNFIISHLRHPPPSWLGADRLRSPTVSAPIGPSGRLERLETQLAELCRHELPVRSPATPPFRPCCGLPASPTPAPPTWIAREVRRQPCIAAVAPMSRGAGRSRRCRTAETAGKRLCGRRAARLMCVSGHPRRQHCVTALPAAGFEVATNGCQPMPGDAADYSTTRLLQSRWLAPRSSCQTDWADSESQS